MKKLLFGLFIILIALFSIESFAMGRLEAVTVNRVDVVHNLMPVIGPGERKPYSIIDLDVMSTGCTEAQDFEIKIVEELTGRQEIEVMRLRPDLCETTPHVISVQLRSDTELGDDVHVLNPLLVQTQVVH